MISHIDALAVILARTPVFPPAATPLDLCLGRVLRECLVASEDLPRTDRATMDGYAVRDDDAAREWLVIRTASTEDAGVSLPDHGEAVGVATGTALLDTGKMRVIPRECVSRSGDRIACGALPDRRHVHARGSDAKAGETLLAPGAPITSGVIALLASVGVAAPVVSRPLRIRHYTTGGEIVAAGAPLPPGSVYDSNGPMIAAMLREFSENSTRAHLGGDYAAALAKTRLDASGGAADLLLVSGGAGPGAGDFTEKLLRDLGYEIIVRGGVNIRPGKPLLFGAKDDGVAFGLPGNPLSHRAAFLSFVLPAIRKMRGDATGEIRIRATVTEDVPDLSDPRPTFHPARLHWVEGEARVTLGVWTASGNVRAMAGANALVFAPPGSGVLRRGDSVTALVFPGAPGFF